MANRRFADCVTLRPLKNKKSDEDDGLAYGE